MTTSKQKRAHKRAGGGRTRDESGLNLTNVNDPLGMAATLGNIQNSGHQPDSGASGCESGSVADSGSSSSGSDGGGCAGGDGGGGGL